MDTSTYILLAGLGVNGLGLVANAIGLAKFYLDFRVRLEHRLTRVEHELGLNKQ